MQVLNTVKSLILRVISELLVLSLPQKTPFVAGVVAGEFDFINMKLWMTVDQRMAYGGPPMVSIII